MAPLMARAHYVHTPSVRLHGIGLDSTASESIGKNRDRTRALSINYSNIVFLTKTLKRLPIRADGHGLRGHTIQIMRHSDRTVGPNRHRFRDNWPPRPTPRESPRIKLAEFVTQP
jgi:hypothetical protein